MKKSISKMEEMFTRANIPLFLKIREEEDKIEFEEGNPNKLRIKKDAEGPIMLILKNDFASKT